MCQKPLTLAREMLDFAHLIRGGVANPIRFRGVLQITF